MFLVYKDIITGKKHREKVVSFDNKAKLVSCNNHKAVIFNDLNSFIDDLENDKTKNYSHLVKTVENQYMECQSFNKEDYKVLGKIGESLGKSTFLNYYGYIVTLEMEAENE